MIDTDKLQHLFSHPKIGKSKREQIRLILWDIAQMLCAEFKNDELASYVFLELDKAVDKVDNAHSNIFAYFWTIGRRELLRQQYKEGRIAPVDIRG